jgi:tetratricopeptide (TPR) repeat protein
MYCSVCKEAVFPIDKAGLDELKATFEVANSRDPENLHKYYFGLGSAVAQLIELDMAVFSIEADRLLKRAIALKPEAFPPYNNLAVLYHDAGMSRPAFKRGLKFADKAIDRAGNDLEKGSALCHKAELYVKLKMYHKAIEVATSRQVV